MMLIVYSFNRTRLFSFPVDFDRSSKCFMHKINKRNVSSNKLQSNKREREKTFALLLHAFIGSIQRSLIDNT